MDTQFKKKYSDASVGETASPPPVELYRIGRLCAICGLSKSSIWSRLDPKSKQYDPSFPKPIRLSATGKGAVAWRSDEVMAWIEHLTQMSRQHKQNSNISKH